MTTTQVRREKPPQRRKVGVKITLDLAALAKLDEAARQAGLSRSGLVERMIEDWVEEDEEDDLDKALGDLALERLANPDEESLPWEEVRSQL